MHLRGRNAEERKLSFSCRIQQSLMRWRQVLQTSWDKNQEGELGFCVGSKLPGFVSSWNKGEYFSTSAEAWRLISMGTSHQICPRFLETGAGGNHWAEKRINGSLSSNGESHYPQKFASQDSASQLPPPRFLFRNLSILIFGGISIRSIFTCCHSGENH